MAKTLKIKLPKRIAGVKIPKGIRKGPIGNFLNSSGGQLLLAEALLAVGGYYAARRLDPNTPAGEVLRHPIDSVRKLGAREWSVGGAPDRFTRALRAAVHAFRVTLQEPFPEGAAAPEQTHDVTTDSGDLSAEGASSTAKKPSSSRSEASRREATSGTH